MVNWELELGYPNENVCPTGNKGKKKCPFCKHFYNKKDMKINIHGYVCLECHKKHFGGETRYEKNKLGLPYN